jgi:predicted SAM-dependent methyltransferase
LDVEQIRTGTHKSMEETKELKLNLGSNDLRYPDFLNVDIRDVPGVDIVDDVRVLSKIKDESVDKIYAEAILEHFAPDKTLDVLRVWVRKLKQGGSILIMVPDGELIINRWKDGGTWADMLHPLFGNIALMREWHGDDMELYMHHTLYCEDMLRKEMEAAGIENIQRKQARHGDCLTLVGTKK